MEEQIRNISKKEAINSFLISKSEYFKKEDLETIRQGLNKLSVEQILSLSSISLINPNLMRLTPLLIFVFGAIGMGIDRIILGQIGRGLLKIFTAGGFLIWFIVDCFTITSRTKDYNMNKFAKKYNFIIDMK
jgi:TM2 domain-containing membrane protein YozV